MKTINNIKLELIDNATKTVKVYDEITYNNIENVVRFAYDIGMCRRPEVVVDKEFNGEYSIIHYR